MNSVSKAVMTFVSQNYGAKKYDRIFKIIKYSTIISVIVGLSLGTIGTLISKPLLGLIADSSEIVDYAFRRVLIICLPYFLCGVMEVLSFSMRALGKSFMSMIISLLGSCVLRIIWVNVMFSFFPSYDLIFVSYPATWIITGVILFAFLSKMLKELKVEASLQQ
jgi:Na+-driven multidrug efflux pump